MKRIIALSVCAAFVAMSYIGWKTFSQITHATAVDTGSYFIGYENSSGIYHDKAWNANQLAGYIGAVGSSNINNSSLRWTGLFTQHGAGYALIFDSFPLINFTNISGGVLWDIDTLASFNVKKHGGPNIFSVNDTGVNGIVCVNNYRLPIADGTPGQLIKTDGLGNLSFTSMPTIFSLGLIVNYNGTPTQGSGLKVIRANNDATGLTGPVGSFTAFVVPTLQTFEVQGYVNVTTVATDVLNMTLTFTDENGIVQTLTLVALGGGVGGGGPTMNAVKFYPVMPVTIRARGGTPIIVGTVLATGGGTITYDAGATITQIN